MSIDTTADVAADPKDESEIRSGVLLSGNEAVARGAVEAGVLVAAGYPGTPSTEILESIADRDDIDVRWSPNEKVALDVALGASLGGVRALVTMKHVGLNVASDTFMTTAYTGVGAGLVIVTADDPGMHSSQNEQDSRAFARMAGVPLLEPADSSEARDFTALAFAISEEFDTPVLIRTTTRVSHNRGLVDLGPRTEHPVTGFTSNPTKYVMIPGFARQRRPEMLKRLELLSDYVEASPLTVESGGNTGIGVVTSGIAHHYVREVLPDTRILKLGMSYPIPTERIRSFAESVDRLFVVEELDPHLEHDLMAAGITVEGKAFFPQVGELSPDAVRRGFVAAGILPPVPTVEPAPPTVTRPPLMCPGCPHTPPFLALRRLGAVVTGDIGCYTLAALEPLSSMDTCVAMGSSIGMAVGMAASGGAGGPVVATIGDSTFLHGGIQGLIDAVYSQADITVLILDNGTVAMTGGQEHPGTGITLQGAETTPVDLVALCAALGVRDVKVIDPYDLAATFSALEGATTSPGPSVVITNRPCVEAPTKVRDRPYEVLAEACTACQACMTAGCPSIVWSDETFEGRRKVVIDPVTCTGCTLCAQICPPLAIIPIPDPVPEVPEHV
ncbi:MAG: indolepyruvate ferredoxin oxidoreductase subunit alpha [Actinobacteria bacterium]|jgi:indolepyruvate ferredoxin oxidoreductase alpha subunit|nr:indolepyruvate ferredoxin oxidoreductase subunit alpha [Actinomycetota bacterium]MBT3688002.1 indolepyruvate ferredoxin oxidoreductase subunit alpha [Actinomycetota bacterium]MBT4036839.1 indolepyruvate ferredoxin oxidoreductase subunit alpha [Actinomycetota bacterium]MBT4278531.1 indolepyruvate ferredoxin oxidoreductase subunit alpha [Actinomycetota bacterium]MBT4343762.1 indolepyruvate ferredoxin oxidoreductase subunit alpha [Actinomycetota bacterium]